MSTRETVDETLQLAVDLATELVRGCSIADIMLRRGRRISTPVASSEKARAIDAIQQELMEGPCLTAMSHGEPVVSNDLVNDTRWPEFGRQAGKLGVRSVASYGLLSVPSGANATFGSLNLYGDEVDLFDDNAVELGALFASHCSTILAAAIKHEGLLAALESRDVIGQAKGILMERHRLTSAEAFEILSDRSQELNRKLRDVADAVTTTGALPQGAHKQVL
ncbi:MAG: GAF domain-containing protein [Glaciecola sp.]|jgi:GAF domain-containing protein